MTDDETAGRNAMSDECTDLDDLDDETYNDEHLPYQDALGRAHEWLEQIKQCGIRDVELMEPGEDLNGGCYRFTFRRTGVYSGLELDVWRSEQGVWGTYWPGLSHTEPNADDNWPSTPRRD